MSLSKEKKIEKQGFPTRLPMDVYKALKKKADSGHDMNWHVIKALKAYLEIKE